MLCLVVFPCHSPKPTKQQKHDTPLVLQVNEACGNVMEVALGKATLKPFGNGIKSTLQTSAKLSNDSQVTNEKPREKRKKPGFPGFIKWRRGELKQSISTNENKGFLKIASRRGTPGARANRLPNNKAARPAFNRPTVDPGQSVGYRKINRCHAAG